MNKTDCPNSDLSEILDENKETVDTKSTLLEYLKPWVKLQSTEEVGVFINTLFENNILDMNIIKSSEIITKLNDSLNNSEQLWTNYWLLFKQEIEWFNIIKLSDENRWNDTLIFTIDEKWITAENKFSNNLVPFNVNNIRTANDIISVLNNKKNTSNILVNECRSNLTNLNDDITASINSTEESMTSFSSELEWSLQILENKNLESKDLLTDNTEVTWVNIKEDLWDNTEKQVKWLTKSEEVKEVISYEKYIVQSWDNLWRIMRNEYGLTNPTDIANLLNVLVDGWKSWINDLKATLKIGQKLQLPSKIFVKSKSRWDEYMKLKTD